MELESLVVAGLNAAKEAGNMIRNSPALWSSANLKEHRKLLLTMLDAVYIEAKKYKTIVAIKPKPTFVPIFEVAVSDQNANIRIYKNGSEGFKPKDPSVFMVETGEARSVARTMPCFA
jgi:site-specific DNA recombinase